MHESSIISVYFYLFLSILFNHSAQATASQKVINKETEVWAESLAEKKQAIVRVYRPNIGQSTGFFVGDSETLVINAQMLHIFSPQLYTQKQDRLSKIQSIKKLDTELLSFPNISHLNTITVVYKKGSILKLEVTGIALSGKDNLAVLKVKGYTGPFLQISNSLSHKDSEFYVMGFHSENLTVIKGRNVPQKQRPRQITIAGDNLTLNSINGSPVLNKDGQVIGVVTENFLNFIFASRLGHLKSLLETPGLRNASFDELKTIVTTEIKQLYKSAKEGDLWAMYMVGMGVKHVGENVKNKQSVHQSYLESSFWFQRAANHNFSPAQLQLGLLSFFGLGLPVNKKRATFLLQKAAQDSTIARFLLGMMLYDGIGISENKQRALFLLKTAAEQGFLLAQLQLFEIFKNDNSDPANKKKSEFWFKEAQKQNVTLATFGEQAIPDIILQSRIGPTPRRCPKSFQ
ncbi:MAG: hypothetical protein OXM55_03060 [Bdellovibrionales bacterium]|nr:hypothetical protein [Bdellovibrionales bacterium]